MFQTEDDRGTGRDEKRGTSETPRCPRGNEKELYDPCEDDVCKRVRQGTWTFRRGLIVYRVREWRRSSTQWKGSFGRDSWEIFYVKGVVVGVGGRKR